MIPAPPSDEDVRRALEDGLRRRDEGGGVVALERAPYPYATSFPLEEVRARLSDGRTLRLILKDLTWERLLGDARRTKPRFLYQPRRPIDTYQRVLAGTGLGTVCYAAVADDEHRRYWLLLERVPGVELWQVGSLATWESVARWLARFHRAFAGEGDALLEQSPNLLRYDGELFRTWPPRALSVVAARGSDSHERHRLERVASRYDDVVETLSALARTFVHGELYPSNVLVDGNSPHDVKVWPIDWEMAGVGPAYLDVAALTAGWKGAEQARLVDAYLDELGSAPWRREGDELARLLDCCRLHYAWQWLGWSPGWSPPPEHARDWVAEALDAAERLGL